MINFKRFLKTNRFVLTLECQPHKKVKHTQTIRWLLPTNYLSRFDYFVRLALKGLICESPFSGRLRTTVLLTSNKIIGFELFFTADFPKTSSAIFFHPSFLDGCYSFGDPQDFLNKVC